MSLARELAQLAFRGLWRRPARSVAAIGGVALAVCIVLCVVGLGRGYEQSLDRDLENLGYEVVVTAKGCPYEAATMILRGGTIPMYLEEPVAREVMADPAVHAATRLFLQAAPPGDHKDAVLHLGVETDYRELKPSLVLQSGDWFADPRADEVVLGANAADLLNLSTGATVDVGHRGQQRRPCRVVGVLQPTGNQEDGTVFLPLATAQFVFDQQDRVTGVGVKLKDPAQLEGFVARIQALPSVQVVTLAHVRQTILNLVASARTMVAVVTWVTVLVALFGVMNSVLYSVLERTPMLGVLKSLGARGRDLIAVVLLETMLMCGVGGVAGWLLAISGRGLVQSVTRELLPYTPTGPLLVLPATVVMAGVGGALLAGLLAGVYPGWRAARIDPVRAIQGPGVR